MARLGSCELYTSANGWVEVDIYDPDDFNYAPIEIPTDSGVWGVPYLRDPADANTPIECFTQSNGWMGVNQTGWEYIEDFETGDLSRWYQSTDATTTVTTTASAVGTYGVELADEEEQSSRTQRIYSHPNEGMTSLPYYPQNGDKWEFFVEFTDAADGHHRVGFGVADQNVNDKFGPISGDFSSDFDNWLAIDMQVSVDELHIWKRINGTRTERTNQTFSPTTGTTYRVIVNWGTATADDLSADIYEYNPGGSDTHIVSTSDTHSDYNTTRRGVFVESELTANEAYWDALRKYPE